MGQFRPLSARRAGPRRKGVSTFGLVLIIVGLIALLVTYSFLPGWVPRFWPVVIIAIGLVGLFRRPSFVSELDALVPGLVSAADRTRRRFSLALVAVGLILLVFTSHLIDDRIAGPAVIIALGIALLWRRYR